MFLRRLPCCRRSNLGGLSSASVRSSGYVRVRNLSKVGRWHLSVVGSTARAHRFLSSPSKLSPLPPLPGSTAHSSTSPENVEMSDGGAAGRIGGTLGIPPLDAMHPFDTAKQNDAATASTPRKITLDDCLTKLTSKQSSTESLFVSNLPPLSVSEFVAPKNEFPSSGPLLPPLPTSIDDKQVLSHSAPPSGPLLPPLPTSIDDKRVLSRSAEQAEEDNTAPLVNPSLISGPLLPPLPTSIAFSADKGQKGYLPPQSPDGDAVNGVENVENGAPIGPVLKRLLETSDKDMKAGFLITDVIHGPSTKFGTGVIANLTNSSVLGMCGKTVVLSTLVHSTDDDKSDPNLSPTEMLSPFAKAVQSQARKYGGMVPLTVEYRQRYHGVGKIPKTHARRDNMKLAEDEVLASRAIDRVLRPLLPKDFYGKDDALAITCSVQACDRQGGPMGSGEPVSLAINSASAALVQSGLPFHGPVACVKLCLMHNGQVVIDPMPEQVEQSRTELLYAGTRDRALMIEFATKEVMWDLDRKSDLEDPGIPEDEVMELIRLAHGFVQPLIDAQLELRDPRSHLNGSVSESSQLGADESDESLKHALGLPVRKDVEAENDTTFTPRGSQEQTQNFEELLESADRVLDEAFEFITRTLDHVSFRLFGYEEHMIDTHEAQNDPLGMNVAVHSGPLLSKRVRGRREHLVRAEIKRLLREEFLPEKVELQRIYSAIVTEDDATLGMLADAVHERLLKAAMCTSATKFRCRADGRGQPSAGGLRTVRPISVTVPLLPDVVHGSALFSRGETQVMCTTTLGAPGEGQPMTNPYLAKPETSSEGNEGEPYGDLPVGSLRYLRSQTALASDYNSKKVKADRERTGDSGILEEVRRAFLHYDFPAYSTGEVERGGFGANRRAIGHGTLAEKAILPCLPPPSVFPYAIRMTSEVTSSNGSSSMATACGATLSLLDAGVPIIAPVAGVSVGLAVKDDVDVSSTDTNGDSSYDSYALLLDITGTEDHYGEMDFKVAGTAHGVTAMQLDVKRPLPIDMLVEAMDLARAGRRSILSEMESQSFDSSRGIICNLRPRECIKSSAPRVEVIRFDPLRKRDLVGPGGAVLRQLEDRFGVSLDLSQEGQCLLHGLDAIMVGKAKAAVMDLVADVEEGEIYEGTVIEIKDFGAVVELLRNKEGLLHVSELTDDTMEGHPEGTFGVVKDVLRVGQKIEVLCTGVDPVQGSIKLSRKKLLRQQGFKR